ncbi:methyl-accepting chemotaxis protein [Petropleomorpha daqingensis]|uniref:Methyl-accepting chemotaxis protein n=1 Tax=Petropleomorpha daqingensis TaxID=2026353 RepID=A0A853CF13_9ACTN|nr:methyl-accepting chemotaxis protein [Petropleomorpha daqingensis]NYJ05741.1 methyl-accepting chemotaxis protein [Petropleomorpha daqingensis]
MDVEPQPTAQVEGGKSGNGFGLRTRMLGAILVVALATIVVGVVGINRMSALSDEASRVYDEGAKPLDGLRQLQSDWWELSAYTARAAITALPPASIQSAQQSAAQMVQTLSDQTAVVAKMQLSPEAEQAFAEFGQAVQTYLQALAKVQQPNQPMAVIGPLLQTMDEQEAIIAKSLVTATEAAAAQATAVAADARDAYTSARTLTIVIIGIGVIVAVVLALVVAQGVIRPARRIREVLGQVAAGDLSVRAGATGGGELGEVAASLDDTLESLGHVMNLVRGSATRLSDASAQLDAASQAIADNARTAAGQAEAVVTSAGEVASSVDTVAAGSSQMESAIREIAHNATEAARVAGQAVDVAENTTNTVGKLGDSSQEIATVVKLINGIAEQTNLLALNATIEAARAGEAGKGFAVVASEVKELAQETARATEDISKRVEAIQADTAGAVEAISQISSVIAEINDFQATIAAAVEEQTATTNEMNRNVAEAASGSQDIAAAISGLAAGTQETNQRVDDAQRAAAELARMSGELQDAVARFTV